MTTKPPAVNIEELRHLCEASVRYENESGIPGTGIRPRAVLPLLDEIERLRALQSAAESWRTVFAGFDESCDAEDKLAAAIDAMQLEGK